MGVETASALEHITIKCSKSVWKTIYDKFCYFFQRMIQNLHQHVEHPDGVQSVLLVVIMIIVTIYMMVLMTEAGVVDTELCRQ